MSSYAPLPTGSDALWLHSFAGAGAIVHSEHCTCRCGANVVNNGRSSPSSRGLSSASFPSSRRSSTLKRVFQTSLALLFLCTAFLIYLHSPVASSAEDGGASVGGAAAKSVVGEDRIRAVDADSSRSRRMIRALRSSSPRSEVETDEKKTQPQKQHPQPPQPKPQQQPQPQPPQQRGTASLKDSSSFSSSSSSPQRLADSPSMKETAETASTLQNTDENIDDNDNLGPSSSSSSSSSHASQTELKDILFTVKTTAKFHKSRLPILLDTWVSFVRDNTYFFTDAEDPELARRLPPHRLVNTNCSSSHNRKALCCKMAAEFDAFLRDLTKRWFCHVDDDTYVNVPEMLRLLRTFDHREDWYLGKPSLRHPIEIIDRDHMNHLSPDEERLVQMRQASSSARNNNNNNINVNNNRATFWFATGGAGFCISRALASKMAPIGGDGRFKIVGDNIRMTDDITMGYIVEHVLKRKLTVVDRFHSHLESMRLIPPSQIESQVTLSYGSYGNEMNVLRLKGFSEREDPSRLRSLHCRLFPGSTTTSSAAVGTLTAGSGSVSSSAANPLICPDRSAILRRR